MSFVTCHLSAHHLHDSPTLFVYPHHHHLSQLEQRWWRLGQRPQIPTILPHHDWEQHCLLPPPSSLCLSTPPSTATTATMMATVSPHHQQQQHHLLPPPPFVYLTPSTTTAMTMMVTPNTHHIAVSPPAATPPPPSSLCLTPLSTAFKLVCFFFCFTTRLPVLTIIYTTGYKTGTMAMTTNSHVYHMCCCFLNTSTTIHGTPHLDLSTPWCVTIFSICPPPPWHL